MTQFPVCECVCACVRVCVCACVHRGLRKGSGILSFSLPYSLEIVSFPESRGSLPPASTITLLSSLPTSQGDGDLNTGPHACAARAATQGVASTAPDFSCPSYSCLPASWMYPGAAFRRMPFLSEPWCSADVRGERRWMLASCLSP